MATEANRSADNLMVLCRLHASVIDEFVDEHPADTLRGWKAAAETDGGGTELSDAELAEISQIWVAQDISLNAETIMVGGTLGGGGGAIGAGAFGGRGGDLGQFPELARPMRPVHQPEQEKLGTGRVLGFEGQPGGPSAVSNQDGEVLIIAGGGGGGYVGTGRRSTSDQFTVSTLMLVDAAEVRDWLTFVLAGGWGTFTISSPPQQVRFQALVIVEAGSVPLGEYALHLAVHDPDGAQVARVTFSLAVERVGTVLRIPVVVPIDLTLAETGLHSVVVSSEVSELRSIEIVVLGHDA